MIPINILLLNLMAKNTFYEEIDFLQQMEAIRDSNLTELDKEKRVTRLRHSLLQDRSSLSTILTTCNTMMGSTNLIIPVIFSQVGVLTGSLTLLILAGLNLLTAQVLVRHGHSKDEDLSQMIERLLGSKYSQLFRFISGLLLALVVAVYYLLSCSMLYKSLEYLSCIFKFNLLDPYTFSFSTFSYQYVAILLGLMTGALACLKRFDLMLKISSYGTIALLFYLLFLLYYGIKNVSESFEAVSSINWFTFQFEKATGTFSLSFMIHNSIIAIYRKNSQ